MNILLWEFQLIENQNKKIRHEGGFNGIFQGFPKLNSILVVAVER